MRLQGRALETGEGIEIEIAGGRIVGCRPLAPDVRVAPDVWLLPGLFDIQVNGYAGHDFNGAQASAEAVASAVRALWCEGVTHLCPTVITASFEEIVAALRAIRAACADPLIAASIVGVHLEGPYISPEDGARGAHPRAHVRPPDWDEFQRWQEAAEGRIGLVTAAPETPGGLAFIERLAEAGVIPAIGHTAATPAQIREAVAAGARLSTHLGNGSHAMLPRHANYLWEQAAADELMASLILDGHHLPLAVARCLVRCKGIERTILISDAMVAAGLPPGRYQLGDAEVEVSSDRRCSLAGTSYLAGSAIALRTGVANAVRLAGVSPAQAVSMATLQPARLWGMEKRLGRLAVGYEASLVVARWQPWIGEIEILRTVVAGQVVYER